MAKSEPVQYLYAPYRLPYFILDKIAESVEFSSEICSREEFEECKKEFDFSAGMAGGYLDD